MNAAIVEAGLGGIVEIIGEHNRTKPLLIAAGGVTIRGGVFRSNRAEPWTLGSNDGDPFFQLGPECSGLSFEDMTFENVGNGCFQIGAPLSDLTFSNITADNVQRFIENRVIAGQTDATITGLTVSGCVVSRFTKGAIRLQYDTHDVHIEQTTGDSGIDGDNFAIGIHMTGTVNNCMFIEVRMDNCIQTRLETLYWNADGFASEEDTHDLTFIDCSSSGCTDGGWDLKADRVHLLRCTAEDNKRNYRMWGADVRLEDCVARNPNLRGGIGTQAQVHATDVARVTLERFVAVDCDLHTIVFDADGSAQIQVSSAQVTRHAGSTLSTQESAASVTFGDVTDSLCGG